MSSVKVLTQITETPPPPKPIPKRKHKDKWSTTFKSLETGLIIITAVLATTAHFNSGWTTGTENDPKGWENCWKDKSCPNFTIILELVVVALLILCSFLSLASLAVGLYKGPNREKYNEMLFHFGLGASIIAVGSALIFSAVKIDIHMFYEDKPGASNSDRSVFMRVGKGNGTSASARRNVKYNEKLVSGTFGLTSGLLSVFTAMVL